MVQGNGRPLDDAAPEGDETERKVSVIVLNRGQSFEDFDPYLKLLMKFTLQG